MLVLGFLLNVDRSFVVVVAAFHESFRFLRCDARFSMSFSIDHDCNLTVNFNHTMLLPRKKKLQLFQSLVRLISWHEWLHGFFIMSAYRLDMATKNTCVSAGCTLHMKWCNKLNKSNETLFQFIIIYCFFLLSFWLYLIKTKNLVMWKIIGDGNSRNNSKWLYFLNAR